MTESQRERRQVFGEAAEQYDAARPGYPADLVTDVLAYADPGPALEIGAGTGKAAVAFAARGVDLTCLEPDPRMAEMLQRRCRPYPAVSVIVSSFEAWRPDRRFVLLYSAQAWHWVDPNRRTDLAAAALAAGGALALFWNTFRTVDADLHAALTDVDDRYGLAAEHSPHHRHVERHPAGMSPDFDREWPDLRLTTDARFTDLVRRRYQWHLSYSTAGYRDLLTSVSLYRMLPPERREAVLADVARAIDAHGGSLDFVADTDRMLARRTASE